LCLRDFVAKIITAKKTDEPLYLIQITKLTEYMIFKNIKVVELAAVLAGPSVGMFLAELGAEVIKIENLTTKGDVTRTWRLKSEDKENSVTAYFSSVNWGKKSLVLDLRQAEAQEIVHKLVVDADIVISSYLPGAAQKLKVDADTLLKINPMLICAEINGYGESEPRAAFDAIIQAEAGFTFMNGLGKNNYKMPVALMDVLAAHQLKEAVLLAYIERLQTGKGKRVSVSLIESGITALVNQATNWLVGNQISQAIGSEHPNIVPYGTIYQTLDNKQIVLAIGTDGQFADACKVLEIPLQENVITNVQRVANREEVNALFSQQIAKFERKELLEKFLAAKIPAGAVNNMQEVFELPQAKENLLQGENIIGQRTFIAKGIEKAENLSSPPVYNQDVKEILQKLGYKEAEISQLQEKGTLDFDTISL